MTEKGNTMAGLTSLPRKKNIAGQPHKLAYITEAESDLLKSRGGAGKPRKGTKGVPSYDFGDYGVEGFGLDPDEDVGGRDGWLSADPITEEDRGIGRDYIEEFQTKATLEAMEEDAMAQLRDQQYNMGVAAGIGDRLDVLNIMDRLGLRDREKGIDLEELSNQRAKDFETQYKALTTPEQKQSYRTMIEGLIGTAAFGPKDYYNIPFLNFVRDEMEGKSWGTGYRSPLEARSASGAMSTKDYDPNTLTGAGTDAASDNRALFESFARANPSLTAVEALSQYNATSPQDQQVSISDVQNMGFNLNAPVGPVVDFRETEAARGATIGAGMIAKGVMSPLSVGTDIALAGTGKSMLGHIIDGFEKLSGYNVPDLGIPSIQEVFQDQFGPSKDTVDRDSFGIDAEISSASNLTDADVGYTDMGLGSFTPDGNESQIALSAPISSEPIIKEKEEIIETPSPAFPTIDTVPQSRVDRIASIYNISKEAAERMLGVTA